MFFPHVFSVAAQGAGRLLLLAPKNSLQKTRNTIRIQNRKLEEFRDVRNAADQEMSLVK